MSDVELKNTIIYLIGIPAVGKYSTAKALQKLAGVVVVDNQLINNPIFSIVGYDGTDRIRLPKQTWDHILKIRTAVVGFIRDLMPPDSSFVFTNVLGANDPVDMKAFRQIEKLARDRDSIFVPVWLTCEKQTIRKRKNSPTRKRRLKDIDLTNIEFWSERFEVLVVDHPNSLYLDTTRSRPPTTARKIVEHVSKLQDAK